MLALANLREDSRLLSGLLEPLEGALNGLAILHSNTGQRTSPSLQINRCVGVKSARGMSGHTSKGKTTPIHRRWASFLFVTFLTVVLVGLAAQAGQSAGRSPGMRCKMACESHVKDSRIRANVCGRCFMGASGGDRGAWVLQLSDAAAISSALNDPDWSVRWGAVRASAKTKGQPELSAFATLIMTSDQKTSLALQKAAVHLAGSKKTTPAELFKTAGKDGSRAAAKIWENRAQLTRELYSELYAIDDATQVEALVHLAKFLGVPEGRALLDAMKTRPRETDQIAADLLVNRSHADGPPAALSLIQGAQAEHKPLVDALFAIYSRKIDALRPALTDADVDKRKAAIRDLWHYGPLAAVELEQRLLDEVTVVRLLAARAVAAGEGKTLAEAASARLGRDSKTPPAIQAAWIDVLGESGGKGCDATLSKIVNSADFSPEARGAAVKALGACGGPASMKVVASALSDSATPIRVGAVEALAYMPRNADAEAAATLALTDPDPAVLAAAVKTVGAQRQTARLDRVQELLEHKDARVRAAAVVSAAALGGPKLAIPISKRLREDSDASVRVAAAKALGDLGGPHAPGALGEAAKRDPDSRVQYVALESLRRLGFR